MKHFILFTLLASSITLTQAHANSSSCLAEINSCSICDITKFPALKQLDRDIPPETIEANDNDKSLVLRETNSFYFLFSTSDKILQTKKAFYTKRSNNLLLGIPFHNIESGQYNSDGTLKEYSIQNYFWLGLLYNNGLEARICSPHKKSTYESNGILIGLLNYHSKTIDIDGNNKKETTSSDCLLGFLHSYEKIKENDKTTSSSNRFLLGSCGVDEKNGQKEVVLLWFIKLPVN